MGGAGKTRTFPRVQKALCVRNPWQIFVRDLADTPRRRKQDGVNTGSQHQEEVINNWVWPQVAKGKPKYGETQVDL